MKKLFVLLLALCLLCSAAMAEENAVYELSWENSLSEQPNLETNGTTQSITIPEVATFLYWIPNDLSAVDVSTIQEEIPPVAAFGAAEGEKVYTVSVFALNIPSLEAYAAALKDQGADIDNAKTLSINGLQAVAVECEPENIDMLLVPVSDTMILLYAFTPLNGDEDWDQVKAYIVSSIRLGE